MNLSNLNPRNAMEALRLANCWEKAQSMRNDATYEFLKYTTDNKTFTVFKNGQPEYITMVGLWTCNCPDFQEKGRFCKHLLCCHEILRDEQMVMEYEQEEASAEIMSTGCDYRL